MTTRESWGLTPPNEWNPPPLSGADVAWLAEHYDRVVHLGYRGWPDQPLPQYVYAQTQREYPDLPMAPLDLDTPWLQVAEPLPAIKRTTIVSGWSDCWFELKVGLLQLLKQLGTWRGGYTLPPPGSRWVTELGCQSVSWIHAAQRIAVARVFLGDCSALHVLAVGLGTPVVLMEPMNARWNTIFYPLGKTGRVHLVTGNDGLPTFDARHVRDALEEALRAR